MSTITCNEEMKGNAKCKNSLFRATLWGTWMHWAEIKRLLQFAKITVINNLIERMDKSSAVKKGVMPKNRLIHTTVGQQFK